MLKSKGQKQTSETLQYLVDATQEKKMQTFSCKGAYYF
jgi:hypothetical protein